MENWPEFCRRCRRIIRNRITQKHMRACKQFGIENKLQSQVNVIFVVVVINNELYKFKNSIAAAVATAVVATFQRVSMQKLQI